MGIELGVCDRVIPSVEVSFEVVFDPVEWAKQQLGGVDLGDKRLNKRAVDMAAKMAADPGASLPNQIEDPGELRRAYGLLNNERVSIEALLAPQCRKTLEVAGRVGLVLMVEDSTELDFTKHPSKRGLGPIGNGKGQGVILHSTLAVEPEERQVLGLAHAQALLRQPVKTKPRPRYRGTPEAQVWEVSAKTVGSPPEGAIWVHVGDRDSDDFGYMVACLDQGKHFLLRAYENRALCADEKDAQEGRRYLIEYARSLPANTEGSYTVQVPAHKGQPAREAQVVLRWAQVAIAPPKHAPGELRQHPPVTVWLLRVWEPQAPEKVGPLEWILLSSLPVTTVSEAHRAVSWYSCRWLCEDYHQCLKTGCRIEQSQLDDGADIMRLLGFCCPLAVRLLQLRQVVRRSAQLPAREVVEPLMVQVLALIRKKDWQTLSISQFWREVAAMGGHQGRKSDGPPGWRTLWQGWSKLYERTEGARLFANPNPS